MAEDKAYLGKFQVIPARNMEDQGSMLRALNLCCHRPSPGPESSQAVPCSSVVVSSGKLRVCGVMRPSSRDSAPGLMQGLGGSRKLTNGQARVAKHPRDTSGALGGWGTVLGFRRSLLCGPSHKWKRMPGSCNLGTSKSGDFCKKQQLRAAKPVSTSFGSCWAGRQTSLSLPALTMRWVASRTECGKHSALR